MNAGAQIRSAARSRRVTDGALGLTLALGCAALIGVAAGIALHLARTGSKASAPALATVHNGLRGEATWAAGVLPAPPITALHDQSGHLFQLSSLRGRTVAIAFFDSYCGQACPLEGRAFTAAERAVPGAQRPVFVAISVNPRDTPRSTRAAARRWGLAGAGAWYWLRGTHAQLARVWKAYHIFVAPPRAGDISHTEALYLLDRRGYERSAYVYPFGSSFVTDDLLTLSRERKAGHV